MANIITHSNALLLEELMKKEFNTDRFSLGGTINADYISQNNNYWHCIAIILAHYYSKGSIDDRNKIEHFFDEIYSYKEQSLQDIPQEKFNIIYDRLCQLLKCLSK